jgi:apolipoprotein N-acyltransferase
MGYFSTIISAVATACAYHWIGPLSIVTLLPLCALQTITYRHLWLWGTIYMGLLHLFFLNLHTFSSIPIAVALWLLVTLTYGAIYGLVPWLLQRLQPHWKHYHYLPITWMLIETIKGLSIFGNPNGNLGYALSDIVNYLPIYSVIGVIGMSGLIVLLNIWLLNIVRNHQRKTSMIAICFVTLASLTIKSPTSLHPTPITVSNIQTAIPQHTKINPHNWPRLIENYKKHVLATTSDIILLPESIIPAITQKSALLESLQHIATSRNTTIIYGTFIADDTGFYNGSISIHPNGTKETYKKQRLMPFGEYLPLRSIFEPWIPKQLAFQDFDAGMAANLSTFKDIKIQPLVCLEGIYPQLYRKSPDTNMVVILANNAWFHPSSAGKKLRQFAQVHAATFQRPVILSANTGHSAIISATGALIAHVPHHNAATLSGAIQPNHNTSLAASAPWLGFVLILCITFGYNRWNPAYKYT